MNLALLTLDELGQGAVDPLLLLKKTDLKEIVGAAALPSQKPIPAEKAELLIRDLRQLVGEYLWVTKLQAEPEHANLAVDLKRIYERVRAQIIGLLEKHGPHLSEASKALHHFYHTPNYNPDKPKNDATYANFERVRELLRKAREECQQTQEKLLKHTDSELGKALPGVRSIVSALGGRESEQRKKTVQLERAEAACWQYERVQMAHKRMAHLRYIADIGENRAILEGPSTVHLLNVIHSNLFGNPAYKVAGPALCGPPGWGKTSVLQDYFRSFGIEPISADIDPGLSSFILMARPSMGLEAGIDSKARLIDLIEHLSAGQIADFYAQHKAYLAKTCGITDEEIGSIAKDRVLSEVREKLARPLQDGFNEDLARILQSHAETKGYTYGLVLLALQQNRPVILNEFPELAEWTFIHGLLTAIPAADGEEAKRPTKAPKEGEMIKNPKGWFYNTISGEWLRVKEKFRICFTGNIGLEYGNAGAPLALLSRIGSSLISVEALPSQEIAETIVWPYLSSRETGHFLLDDETAYRLHFLISEVFPKLRAKLERDHRGKHMPISNRVLIDICKAMNPETNYDPCDLDEALMKALIRPSHALRYTEGLQFIIAILKATGYLSAYDEELKAMLPDFGGDRITAIIKELKNPFNKETYKKNADRYEGKCVVCSVTRCPCHGEDNLKYVDYIRQAAELSKVVLDPVLLDDIKDWQKDLEKAENWPMALEAAFANLDTAKLSKEAREGIAGYLTDMIGSTQKSPDTLPDHLPILLIALKKAFLSATTLDNEWKSSVIAHWDKVRRDIQGGKSPAKHSMLRPFFEVQAALCEIYSDSYRMHKDTVKFIEDRMKDLEDPSMLVLVNRMRLENAPDLTEAIAEKIKQLDKSTLLQECRLKIVGNITPGSAAPTTIKKKAVPAGIKAVVGFESEFESIEEGMIGIENLLDLKLIRIEEVLDLLTLVEQKLNDAVQGEKLPTARMPYIRIIRRLAKMKKVNLDEAAKFFFKDRKVPLPPLRKY